MDKSSFGVESHVAQQSRRDKLRILQQSSTSSIHHLGDLSDNLEQFSVHPGGFVQVRNVVRTNNNNINNNNGSFVFDPSIVFPTGVINFGTNSNAIDGGGGDDDPEELGAVQPNRPTLADRTSSFTDMSPPVLSNLGSSYRTSTDNAVPQGCGHWRSVDSHQSFDLMVNYASGSVGGGESNSQKSMLVGEVLSNNAKVSCSVSAPLKSSSYSGYQDVEAQPALASNPFGEISGQDRHINQFREMQFASHHPLYHSTVQDVNSGSFGERINLLSPFGNQSPVASQFYNNNVWMGRPIENCHQWSGELGFIARKGDQELRTTALDPSTQGLALSLSSNPPSKVNEVQYGEGYDSELIQSKSSSNFKEPHQDSKFTKSPSYNICPVEKPSFISKGSTGKALNDIVGPSSCVLRNTGPLGPFTGYATILKSSRFLKPAQELLDEICTATCSKFMTTCQVSERIAGDQASTSTLANAANNNDTNMEYVDEGNNNSGASSSIYTSNEGSGDLRAGCMSSESYGPEYQQKKARLLFLQEEVCRRYKQYHQQMQMVASSFESVAGLSAATPCMSLALKTISRNFRCLRSAISDQLKHVTKALGEDIFSPNTIASGSKGDTSMTMLRYMDQSFQKHRCSGANVSFVEPQQHVWRPQRGLPERSVAILRAWLFDHFLHPYPTDTDKHMLATKTGLSRNQVSNWFINARVRVWKPMVEEIHMLESKTFTGANDQTWRKIDANSTKDTSHPTGSGEQMEDEQWNQQNKSSGEVHVPTSMHAPLMNFLPYQNNAVDVTGLGNVSLTLGLRHGVENAQQQHQQQLQQHEDQLRRQFSGHQMIHDFVG